MPYDWEFITSRLATGAAPVDESFVESLAEGGITHIIDVTDSQDDTSLLATHPAMAYLYNPTADDGTHKEPSWFGKSLVFALPAFALRGASVYTHCSAGVNRGPSTAYAIMCALGWDGVTALALMKSRRPQVQARYAADADQALRSLGYL